MRFYNFCMNHWLIPILEKYFGAGVNKKLSITYIVLPIVLSLYKIQILRTSCMMNSMKKNITLNDFITCLPETEHLEEGHDNLKVEHLI